MMHTLMNDESLFTHPCLQIATNKRYAGNTGWTVSEVAERAAKDIGKIDVLVRGGRPRTLVRLMCW